MNSRSMTGAGVPGTAAEAAGAWFTPEGSIRLAASIVFQSSGYSEPNGPSGRHCSGARAAKTPGATQADICRWSYRIAPAYAAILMSLSRCAVSHSANGFPAHLRRGSQFVAPTGLKTACRAATVSFHALPTEV